MQWLAIMAALLTIIKQCRSEGNSKKDIMSELENPSGFAKMRFERRIRKDHGLSGWRNRKKWQKKRKSIMPDVYKQLKGASREDMKEIIDDTDD